MTPAFSSRTLCASSPAETSPSLPDSPRTALAKVSTVRDSSAAEFSAVSDTILTPSAMPEASDPWLARN